jgi:flagellar FliL protein
MAEAAEAVAVPEPRLRKSNMVVIIIIAVLSTILVGGGVATFFVLRGGSHPEESAKSAEGESDGAAKGESAPAKKGEKGKKEAAPKGAPIYVGLEPPFVVNFGNDQTVRFLQVTVQLMTRDNGTAQLLKENDPLVRNDLLFLFGNQDATQLATREGKEVLRKSALDTVRNIVKNEGGKPDYLEAVYFTTFVMQ